MKLSVCYIIENENNDYFKAGLSSIDKIADEIIIIDGGSTDGTLEYLESLNDERIKVINIPYQHDIKGSDGKQRNNYLKHATGEWVLVMDADEIIDDNVHKLKEMKLDKNVYDIQMIHFFYHFGLVDASHAGQPATNPNYIHRVPRRFFKRTSGLYYEEREHPVLMGFEGDIGTIDDVIIYHLGEVKLYLQYTLNKYRTNVKKSKIHSKPYLEWWKNSRLWGEYPVKEIEIEDITSSIIKRLIGWKRGDAQQNSS